MAFSSIDIYQICIVKNGYKKTQKPCDIWFFGVHPFGKHNMVEVAGKQGVKQLITVFADAPEENNERAEPKSCAGDRLRIYFRAVLTARTPQMRLHYRARFVCYKALAEQSSLAHLCKHRLASLDYRRARGASSSPEKR